MISSLDKLKYQGNREITIIIIININNNNNFLPVQRVASRAGHALALSLGTHTNRRHQHQPARVARLANGLELGGVTVSLFCSL